MAKRSSRDPPLPILEPCGELHGHNGMITKISLVPQHPDLLITASRDKTLLVWKLSRDSQGNISGRAFKSLFKHGHFVSDVVCTNDGTKAISASWDRTLRMWDLETFQKTADFIGHTHDVLSVAISPDNRHILSGSRDKTMRLWNVLGQNKAVFTAEGNQSHDHWVTSVKFVPGEKLMAVSAGWDRKVKVWDMAAGILRIDHHGHNNYINSLAVSPDGSTCASAGKEGKVNVWDLVKNQHLWSSEQDSVEINCVIVSPTRYWLLTASGPAIKIYDLDKKELLDVIEPEDIRERKLPTCVSLVWSDDGETLFAGYSDHVIRAWRVADPFKEWEEEENRVRQHLQGAYVYHASGFSEGA